LEGNEDLSAEHLRRARQSGASMVPILLRIGWVHLLFGRPKEAEDAFLDVIEKDNKIAEAHTGLGVSLHAQGRNDEAERSLCRAIVLEFHNPVAHVHLGRVLAK